MMAVIGVGIDDLLPGSPWFALHLQEGPVFTSNIHWLGQSARLRFDTHHHTNFSNGPRLSRRLRFVIGILQEGSREYN